MLLTSREILNAVRRLLKRYHDTGLYTATVVTLILILQIVSMFKGG